MAQLDRLLAAILTNGADALVLDSDDVAKLEIGGATRPLTHTTLAASEIATLLKGAAEPDVQAQLDAGTSVTFSRQTADRTFQIRATANSGRWHVDARAAGLPAAHPLQTPAFAAGNGHPRDEASLDAVRSFDGSAQARVALDTLLRVTVEKGASDLHLRVGEPPIIRRDGAMTRLTGSGSLTQEQAWAMIQSIMPERNRHQYQESNDTDFAYELADCARFRCNAARDRHGAVAVFRQIPAKVVTVEDMGMSEEVQRLCYLTKGLVLVTGPTGSGKSTTLCALIDLVNRSRHDHIITIEDPIEFVHANKSCVITQRQVGVHTKSFKSALRAALREDPDIVLVGEMRDLETVSIAIETAETGHLVFGTLHTTTAASTIDRIIDQFPADRQPQIRVMLAESLKGVISQTLCKKIGGGRVAAREILLSTPSITNLIREGKTFQIPSVLQTSKRLGMVTMNDALMALVDAKLVDPKEAYLKAVEKTGIVQNLKGRGVDVGFAETDGSASKPEAAAPATKTFIRR